MNAVLQSGYGTDNSRLSARVLLLRSNDLQLSSNLVVDREFSGKISTRRLIIEAARFNVIRAYSGVEAIESVQNFPSLDGMVLDAGLSDRPADEVVRELKKLQPTLPIVVICAPGADECPGRNITCSLSIRYGYKLMQSLRPLETSAIRARNRKLSKEE